MTQGIAEVLGEGGGLAGSPFDGVTPPIAASYTEFSFTCQRFLLLQLAERAGNVVPSREGYQTVLNNFYVEVSPGQLRVTGTDMELRVTASTTAVLVGHSGEPLPPVVLPAKRFLSILREAPDGDVTVRVRGDSASVTAGSASWELKLSSNGADYPAPPDLSGVEWHEVARVPLLAALKVVRHAVSKAGSKPSYSQVDIRPRPSDGIPCATACDGTRFAQVPLPGFPLEMRIPAAGSPAAADELARLLAASEAEKVRAGRSADGRRLFFGVDSAVFIVAQLPLEFPDVWNLLLEPVLGNTEELTVGRDALREALRRVRINADTATSAIGLQLSEDRVTVFARDKYGNQAEEALAVGWAHGDRLLVLNHQFLAEMLAVHASGQCTFRLGRNVGRRKAPLLLADPETGVTGIINQMAGSLVGYA